MRVCLDEAKELVSSSKKVTEGFHWLDMIDLFVTLMDMHVRKHENDPDWLSGAKQADEVAERLVGGVPCPTSLMIAAEYYRLSGGLEDVESVYRRMEDLEGSKFKIYCMRAARGEQVDWSTLHSSAHIDDQLAALALSKKLPIKWSMEERNDVEPLAVVGMYLARGEFETAKSAAEYFLDNSLRANDADQWSAPTKRFIELCLQNLLGRIDDAEFLDETIWPLQASFRLGLKHYALKDHGKAKKHLDEVIESLHPQVYFNERAHWAAVLRHRIDEQTQGD